MKKTIRLTESDLHRIVKESVNRILNEVQHNGVSLHGNRPEDWFAIRDAHEFGSKGNERATKNGNELLDRDFENGNCSSEQLMGRWHKAINKGAEKSKRMGFR